MNTQYTSKEFSRELYSRYDKLAKVIADEIMVSCFGAKLRRENIEEGKTYREGCWDLEYEKNGKTKLIESEIKDKKFFNVPSSCKKGLFRFKTLDIPSRKIKNKADYFFIISSGEDIAIGILKSKLDKFSEKITKDTIYVKNESFIRVNLEFCDFFIKENNKWKKVT